MCRLFTLIQIFFFIQLYSTNTAFAQENDKPVQNQTSKLVWAVITESVNEGLLKQVYSYNENKQILTSTIFELDSITKELLKPKSRISNVYDDGKIRIKTDEYFFDDKWAFKSRVLYEYDSLGNNTILESQNWVGFWENDLRNEYSYDNHSNLITSLVKIWNSGNWTNSERYTMTYNDSNKLLSQFREYYTDKWMPDQKSEYIYDNSGNMTQFTYFIFEDDWSTLNRTINKYNQNNLLIESVFQFRNNDTLTDTGKELLEYDEYGNNTYWISKNFTDGNWINSFQRTNTFDEKNRVITSTVEMWDSTSWKKQDRTSYAYNQNSDILTNTIEIALNDEWVPLIKNIYTYNVFQQETEHVFMKYSGNDWQPQTRKKFEYDTEGDLQKIKYEVLDVALPNNDDLLGFISNEHEYTQYCSSLEVSYDPATEIIEDKSIISSEKDNLRIYPNPASDIININIKNLSVDAAGFIDIYNSTGEFVSMHSIDSDKSGKTGESTLRLGITHLPTGMYIVRYGTDYFSFVKK